MESFARLKNPLALLALVLAQTLWLAVQVHRPVRAPLALGGVADGRNVSLLRSCTMFFFGPVEHATEATGAGIRHLWANYVDLRHARQQNVSLRGEIARLHEEQVSFAEDAAEGRRLQSLLGFKQQYIASTVAAEVIGTSGSDHSHVLWIDKGSADGLQPEQPVITPDGVVGKLREVMPHTAQLLLLNDVNSGAGVLLASSRMRGILRGTAAGEVVINDLTADDRIKPGEHVITSGGDQVFPRGLPIGTITAVAADPQHPPYTLIQIKPTANLRQLEEVLVITGTMPQMPPAAQADASQAEITAEENKRAADLIAERLPSLHGNTDGAADTNGTGSAGGASGSNEVPGASGANAAAVEKAGETSGGVPGVPNSGMPAPRPVVHPDRYSPGSAPPANDLTPGAPAQPKP